MGRGARASTGILALHSECSQGALVQLQSPPLSTARPPVTDSAPAAPKTQRELQGEGGGGETVEDEARRLFDLVRRRTHTSVRTRP